MVLGVLFDVQDQDNPAFAPITNSLKNIVHETTNTNITGAIRLAKLLPKNFEVFYKYRGSLTTPPCSENVIWIVFPEVLKIGRKQLEQFRGLENTELHHLSVARKLQDLGDRKIYVSDDDHCEDRLAAYAALDVSTTTSTTSRPQSPEVRLEQPSSNQAKPDHRPTTPPPRRGLFDRFIRPIENRFERVFLKV